MPSYNSLDDHIVDECASLLAKINLSLNDMDLPLGISQDFFKFMTPANAYKSYTKSLTKALDNNEMLIIENIKKRIELLEYIKDWEFDTKRLSYYNSHGDFTTNQLVINDKINIIDFTSACKQPIIWEITRFFFHADKSALNGKLNINRFNKYLEKYTDVLKLNEYDLKNIFKLYFYQILVCDYYSQYYKESNENKKIDYLNQANFASKIIFSNEKLIKNMS